MGLSGKNNIQINKPGSILQLKKLETNKQTNATAISLSTEQLQLT
jgi:hypothetical protein